jgi:hypothetical protein
MSGKTNGNGPLHLSATEVQKKQNGENRMGAEKSRFILPPPQSDPNTTGIINAGGQIKRNVMTGEKYTGATSAREHVGRG